MNISKTAAISIVLLLILTVPAAFIPSPSDADSNPHGGDFLMDMGNGDTQWFAIGSGTTYADVAVSSATAAGYTCTYISPSFTVNGRTTTTIGAADSGGSYTNSGTRDIR